jgi:hypothetical protein
VGQSDDYALVKSSSIAPSPSSGTNSVVAGAAFSLIASNSVLMMATPGFARQNIQQILDPDRSSAPANFARFRPVSWYAVPESYLPGFAERIACSPTALVAIRPPIFDLTR